MTNRKPQPYWAFLYNDFIRQTELSKMKARLGSLESALSERLQELDGTITEYHVEKIAIKEAEATSSQN